MKVSIITPVYNTPERYLRECIQSVLAQTSPDWELLLVDDGSTDSIVSIVLKEAAESDPRIKVKFNEHLGISGASNAAIEMAEGDFCAFLDHDDLLSTQMVEAIGIAVNQREDLEFIYTDKDHISPEGQHYNRFWKPDWHPYRILGGNFAVHCMIYRTELLRVMGGLRKEYETTQDYDLVLRAADVAKVVGHIPLPLYSWRLFPGTTSQNPSHYDVGVSCLADTLKRRGLQGHAEKTRPGLFKTTFMTDQKLIEISGGLFFKEVDGEKGSEFLTRIKELSGEGEREVVI